MKKTKKALASLAIAGMTLSMVPFNVFAASPVPTRISGDTAAQTAVAIAEQTGWTGTAILASSASYGMVDALTAGPLASYLKAPILLTGAGNSLDTDTKAELNKLAVKTVYVTSGTAVIKQGVLDELKGMGISVVPLGGFDRAETSVNIAKKMTGVTKVAVANGLQDALSIASVAAAANQPILLTDKDALPSSVADYLAANSGIVASDVIGGTGVISDAVKSVLPGATRHFGQTAYDTNNQVIQDFDAALDYDNVYVANGVTGIDALAGAPLAAQTKSAIVLTDGKAVPAAATFVHSKLADGAVVTALGGSAVVPEAVRTGVVNGEVNPPAGALSVTSVSAVSANSLKVVFNQAPADTSKVTFAVTRSTTPVTTTATWNAAKTEATITSSSNLPEGTYSVAVKNDTVDLGNSSVTVTAQKVAKINITSTKLAVSGTGAAQKGYATYKVEDQYGNDITTSYLANSLQFQTGVATVNGKSGVLTLSAPTVNLIQFATVVITGYDSTSGVSTSATLATSTALGTLSEIKLDTLKSADEKDLTAGDSSNTWYLDYTATDISGNPTKDYNLVKEGLILNDGAVPGSNDKLTTSSSYVIAKVIHDPSDDAKAVIEVKVTNDVISMDIPVSITAMTFTGSTSTFNTTLKKAAIAETFTLMSPSYDIAVGEKKEIPFVAYDQNGVQVKRYDDLKGNVTFSPANQVQLEQNADGTAKVMVGCDVGGFTGTGPQIITAVTGTGKLSTVTLNIQKAAVADTLALDTSVLVSAMQQGSAEQTVDFGYNYGGLSAKDQYGRSIDMWNHASDYEVLATATGSVSVAGTNPSKAVIPAADAVAFGGNGIRITSGTAGSGTVTFKLIKKVDRAVVLGGDSTKVIDTKSATFSIVADKDIKGYTMDTVAAPIYAHATDTIAAMNAPGYVISGRTGAYEVNPCVYGKTASGSKVVLAGSPIIGASVDNTTDFMLDGAVGAYDSVNVLAGKLGANITAAETLLTVNVKSAFDGSITSLTTPIKSSNVTPVAKAIAVGIGNFVTGVSKNSTGDVITIKDALLTAGKSMARFDASGSNANRAPVYFLAVDSYGTKAMPLAQIVKVSEVTTATGAAVNNFGINADGTITGSAVAGTTITLSGITTNGLVKTIQLVVN